MEPITFTSLAVALGGIGYIALDRKIIPDYIKGLEGGSILFCIEGRIYWVEKGNTANYPVLVSKTHSVNKEGVVRNVPSGTKHLGYFERKVFEKTGGYYIGNPNENRVQKFFLQVGTYQKDTDHPEGHIEVKKIETDHLRLFYQYLIVVDGVKTGNRKSNSTGATTGDTSTANDGKSEMVQTKVFALLTLEITNAYKAKYVVQDHTKIADSKVSGAIRDWGSSIPLEYLNEGKHNEKWSRDNPNEPVSEGGYKKFKTAIMEQNEDLSDQYGFTVKDSIFLFFKADGAQAEAVIAASNNIEVQRKAGEAQKAYFDQLGTSEYDYIKQFDDYPDYMRVLMARELAKAKNLTSVGAGAFMDFDGVSGNGNNKNNNSNNQNKKNNRGGKK